MAWAWSCWGRAVLRCGLSFAHAAPLCRCFYSPRINPNTDVFDRQGGHLYRITLLALETSRCDPAATMWLWLIGEQTTGAFLWVIDQLSLANESCLRKLIEHAISKARLSRSAHRNIPTHGRNHLALKPARGGSASFVRKWIDPADLEKFCANCRRKSTPASHHLVACPSSSHAIKIHRAHIATLLGFVEISQPLQQPAAVVQVFGTVIGCPYLVAFSVASWRSITSGSKPSSLRGKPTPGTRVGRQSPL